MIDTTQLIQLIFAFRVEETSRGNPEDIGKAKKLQWCKWFSIKCYASVVQTKEYMEKNLGWEF